MKEIKVEVCNCEELHQYTVDKDAVFEDVSMEDLYRERLNEVYNERDRLVALISSIYPSYLAIDETGEDGFKNVVYIDTPCGQLSWHIQDDELSLFGHLVVKENNWDGHTTEEKYKRIEQLIKENV